MPRNVYSEINLHFVWHTKDSAPVLVGSIETHLHTFLKDRALQRPGLFTKLVVLKIMCIWL